MEKIIHYCWFGKGKKNKKILKCIDSWKKYLPNWKIKEWNEENFDISSNKYVKQAYDLKKYAFVSDYVRMYALFNEGGLYLDTDIEIRRNFEKELFNKKMIISYELDNTVMTGLIYTVNNNPIIKEALEYYQDKEFIISNGKIDDIPNTMFFSEIIKNKGFFLNGKYIEKDRISIYPYDYFCAFDMKNSCYNITSNTYAIHHYDGSWQCGLNLLLSKFRRKIFGIIGRKNITKIKNIIKK